MIHNLDKLDKLDKLDVGLAESPTVMVREATKQNNSLKIGA